MVSATHAFNPQYFLSNANPYGLTYGQWTVMWWRWLTAIPTRINPAADEYGENADVNQTDPSVWYLAGTLGGRTVHRTCTLPHGKSILFPVINYEMNFVEKPELKTESELIAHVKEDEDDIKNLAAVLDGQEFPVFRVRSDPVLFTLTLPPDNLFDVPAGTTRATSDGYWVFLKPLEPGKHKLFFAGSCSAGSRNVKATYDLTVSN